MLLYYDVTRNPKDFVCLSGNDHYLYANPKFICSISMKRITSETAGNLHLYVQCETCTGNTQATEEDIYVLLTKHLKCSLQHVGGEYLEERYIDEQVEGKERLRSLV